MRACANRVSAWWRSDGLSAPSTAKRNSGGVTATLSFAATSESRRSVSTASAVSACERKSSQEFSADNVPYKPAHWLKVTTAGLKPGDFVMVTGYPGSTSRLDTA